MDDSRSDLLSSSDVLAVLMSRPSLRRIAARCVLRAVRVEGEWLYRRCDLEAWLEEHREEEKEVACSQS